MFFSKIIKCFVCVHMCVSGRLRQGPSPGGQSAEGVSRRPPVWGRDGKWRQYVGHIYICVFSIITSLWSKKRLGHGCLSYYPQKHLNVTMQSCSELGNKHYHHENIWRLTKEKKCSPNKYINKEDTFFRLPLWVPTLEAKFSFYTV